MVSEDIFIRLLLEFSEVDCQLYILKHSWETLRFLKVFFKDIGRRYLWFLMPYLEFTCLPDLQCERPFHTTAFSVLNILKVCYEK